MNSFFAVFRTPLVEEFWMLLKDENPFKSAVDIRQSYCKFAQMPNYPTGTVLIQRLFYLPSACLQLFRLVR